MGVKNHGRGLKAGQGNDGFPVFNGRLMNLNTGFAFQFDRQKEAAT
jgi:hypothetical protein